MKFAINITITLDRLKILIAEFAIHMLEDFTILSICFEFTERKVVI